MMLRREQGHLDEFVSLIERTRRMETNTPFVRVATIMPPVEIGNEHAARQALEVGTIDDVARPPLDLRSMSWLAEVCATLYDRARAEILYQHLLPHADRNLATVASDYAGGSVSLYLGLLATTLARWDEAERNFAEALAKNAEWGYRLYVAYTQYAWADMLIRRGRREDRERALGLLGQARATADELGMARLLRLIAVLDEQLGPSVAARPAGLSPRELDVLRLLIEGLSDREIAAALFISHRTVMTHVANILNKLGVSSRTAAASLAVRDGIV
jgi:DNA-binding CsgD family transcriptional regulator